LAHKVAGPCDLVSREAMALGKSRSRLAPLTED
jgi:hypothetical protein